MCAMRCVCVCVFVRARVVMPRLASRTDVCSNLIRRPLFRSVDQLSHFIIKDIILAANIAFSPHNDVCAAREVLLSFRA